MPILRSASEPEEARNVGAGPAAGIRPVGRRVVAEIGREQHGAREQVLDRRAATRSAKPPPAEWPISVSGAVGDGLADHRDEIGEIVLELADIGDIAARSRGAMAANVDRLGLDAARRQRPRQRMDGGSAGTGRAVDHDRAAPGRGAGRGIMAEAEHGAVAGLEPLDAPAGCCIVDGCRESPRSSAARAAARAAWRSSRPAAGQRRRRPHSTHSRSAEARDTMPFRHDPPPGIVTTI